MNKKRTFICTDCANAVNGRIENAFSSSPLLDGSPAQVFQIQPSKAKKCGECGKKVTHVWVISSPDS